MLACKYGWGISTRATAGYFVSDHVNVGGFIGLGYFESDATRQTTTLGVPGPVTSSESESCDYSLGPLFNYHFRPSTRIVPFVGISGGWFRSESENRSADFNSNAENDGWTFQAGGGAHFFLNPHVALKLELRHRRIEVDSEQTTTATFTSQSSTGTGTDDSTDVLIGLAVFLHVNRR